VASPLIEWHKHQNPWCRSPNCKPIFKSFN
jgi:hypothetical protein